MEIIVIVAILFALICGYVAGEKNRSVIGWAIAGAMAGIFALLILAMVPTIKKTA
jgi:branched-subunit amino acid transport protein